MTFFHRQKNIGASLLFAVQAGQRVQGKPKIEKLRKFGAFLFGAPDRT